MNQFLEVRFKKCLNSFHPAAFPLQLRYHYPLAIKNPPKKLITIFCVVIAVICLFLLSTTFSTNVGDDDKVLSSNLLNLWSKQRREFEYFQQWLDYDWERQIRPEFDRFIHSKIMGSGLGNQLYRFSSLYAMGQLLNRTPVFVQDEKMMHQMMEELARGFPNLHKRVYFLKSNLNSTANEKVDFEKHCCDYVDPKILLKNNNKARVLMLNGLGYFENHKYFHSIKYKIMDLLEFGKEIVENVTEIIRQTFRDDQMFKVCVHTRNGDFARLGVSRADQVGPAIDRILRYLPKFTGLHERTKTSKYSLLLFGLDKPLLQSLKFNNESLHKLYYVVDLKMGRIEELHFAQKTCNMFLNTASLSSYAFWMGYLMPENRPIFYIRKHVPKHKVDTFHSLPQEWFPIEEEWLNDKFRFYHPI